MKRVTVAAAVILFSFLIFHEAKSSPEDRDQDGLVNDAEIQIYGTNPDAADTDFDTKTDGQEIEEKTDPLSFDGKNLPPERLASLTNKRIEIDLSDQKLRYYSGKALIGEIPISSGLAIYPTPLGTFSVQEKIPVKHYRGRNRDGSYYNYPNTKWNLKFFPSYYIHGTYWHNDFGIRPRSHGCINVSYHDMPQLYEFADVGAKVVIKK